MTEFNASPQGEPTGDAVAVAADGPPPRRAHALRRLYDWVIHWAQTPYASLALFLLAFAESSFFPIPPDVLLIAMAIAAPTRAFRYALISTVGSVVGGMAGYLIGYAFWEAVRPVFIPHIFSAALFDYVRQQYQSYDVWIVFTAAFTPIPYKVITITAGVMHISFLPFVLASAVGRAGRMFLVAALIRVFGQPIRNFIERYFNLVTIVFTVLLIASFVLVRYWREISDWLRGLF